MIFRPIERLIYRLTGIDETHEMRWTEYAVVMLLFSLVTMLVTYAIERLQHLLPLNPQHLAAVAPDLALNTAASFTTNTNWQSYVPETTMSYLTQMLTLAYHNFFSAAVGIALAVALIRGISRRESKTLGNFWVDTTRASLWVLLPACLIYALLLVSQGVVQNFRPYDQAKLVQSQTVTATGTDGKTTTQTVTTQSIAQGPTASQEAIKMLGTNGGGFFNANSAHPFENPTPLTNLMQMFSIFVIPAALTVTLGRMTRTPKHGWAVFAAMATLFFVGVLVAYYAEAQPNPLLHSVNQHVAATQAGGNMEVLVLLAKKSGSASPNSGAVRHGYDGCQLWCSQLGMHDSFMPLGRPGSLESQHHAWRGDLRWRRGGAVRYVDLRRTLRVYCRTDGWPHPGVSR